MAGQDYAVWMDTEVTPTVTFTHVLWASGAIVTRNNQTGEYAMRQYPRPEAFASPLPSPSVPTRHLTLVTEDAE